MQSHHVINAYQILHLFAELHNQLVPFGLHANAISANNYRTALNLPWSPIEVLTGIDIAQLRETVISLKRDAALKLDSKGGWTGRRLRPGRSRSAAAAVNYTPGR